MMSISRKHHYVSQMYLRGFANDKDQCFMVNAMGFAMRQIYAKDDQFYYQRSPHFPSGRGFTQLDDPVILVREG
jgi:hypothetical protein